jgi:hypothetical protein
VEYYLEDKIEKNGMVHHVAHTQEGNTYKILVTKLEGKNTLLGRQRYRWEDIKMDLRETGYVGVDWTDMVQVTDKWLVLEDKVMSLWSHKMLGTS